MLHPLWEPRPSTLGAGEVHMFARYTQSNVDPGEAGCACGETTKNVKSESAVNYFATECALLRTADGLN